MQRHPSAPCWYRARRGPMSITITRMEKHLIPLVLTKVMRRFFSWYTLKGDTVIDGRQYMKMYRNDEVRKKETYYGAYREDEEGRVYMAEYRGEKDFKIIEFIGPVMKEENNGDWPYTYPGSAIRETIKVNGKLFTRYRYTGSHAIGVEGVGYQRSGLTTFAFEPIPTCICDYEELYSVSCNDFYFTASDFDAPKEIELAEGEQQLIELSLIHI